MNVETLKIRRSTIEERFNATQKDREQARAKVAECDIELNRLQGEHRLISEFILDVEASTLKEEGNEPE